jgi:hypothetical protein
MNWIVKKLGKKYLVISVEEIAPRGLDISIVGESDEAKIDNLFDIDKKIDFYHPLNLTSVYKSISECEHYLDFDVTLRHYFFKNNRELNNHQVFTVTGPSRKALGLPPVDPNKIY